MLACLLLCAVAAARGQKVPVPPLPDQLTLETARELAIERNPTLDAARERVQAALAALRGAEAEHWPSLDLTASATRYEDVSDALGGQLLQTPYETYRLEAQLNWLLFSGFRTASGVDSAEATASAASLGLDNARRLLSQAVGSAFYQALLARENVQVAERDAAFNDGLKSDAEKRRDAGKAGREDVLNFSVRALLARNQAIAARRDRRTARIALAELLDLTPAVLPQRVSLAAPESAPRSAPDVDAEIAFALQNRPDLRAAQRQLEQAQAELRRARSDKYPQVNSFLSAARTHTANSGLSDGTDNDVAVGVSLTWSAFDAGRTDADVQTAAAQIAERRHDLASRKTAVAATVREQHERLQAALQQLDLSRQALDMTREIRNIVTRQYNAGRVTITRLNEAQTDLVRAESQVAAARIRTRLARQNLNAATGRLGSNPDGDSR